MSPMPSNAGELSPGAGLWRRGRREGNFVPDMSLKRKGISDVGFNRLIGGFCEVSVALLCTCEAGNVPLLHAFLLKFSSFFIPFFVICGSLSFFSGLDRCLLFYHENDCERD